MNATDVLTRFKPNTLWTLVALAAGFGLGILAHGQGWTAFDGPSRLAAPLGQVWCNALRLLAYPLVALVLVRGLNVRDERFSAGRMAVISMIVFVTILTVGAVLGLVLTTPMVGWLGVEFGALKGVANEAPAKAAQVSATDWLAELLGVSLSTVGRFNLLPILVVSVCFALAVRTLAEDARRVILDWIEAVLSALFVLLGWLLAVAPFAVFILSLDASLKTGTAVAGAFASYITVLVVLLILINVALYPTASVGGGVSLVRFARAIVPAQAVAAGTRSSLASLPAMLASARTLGVPDSVAGFVLPLAVGAFKANRTITGTAKLLFLAHVYGIELTPGTIALYVSTIALLSFASPGTPSGGVMASTPALLDAGVPMEGIVMAHAVDALPDVFKTLVNVTGDLTATVIVARFTGARATAPEG